MKFKGVQQIRSNCITHAKDLLEASKTLFRKKLFNISYHLAVLSLEEIGKSIMVVIGQEEVSGAKGYKLLKQAGEAHKKKLFWALWAPTFGKEQLSKEQIRFFIVFSQELHEKRLEGLYVDPFQKVVEPSGIISRKQAQNLITLVETRIKLEETKKLRRWDHKVKDNFRWFFEAVEDPRKKKLIFGKKSIEKLVSFKGDGSKWVGWLRKQFDKAEKESKRLLQGELTKEEPSRKDKSKRKWKVRFKLISPSHSIRERVLNGWNYDIDLIKLTLGKKTPRFSELIVDMVLPKGVPLRALWYAGWGEAKRFAVSLSIATQGYFWWYLPKDVSRFYERITDLENDSEIVVERRPILTIDWGNNVLTNRDLTHAIFCYRFLPRKNLNFLNAYVTGISLMGKNDIHTPFEAEMFLQFYHALIFAIKYYKDYKSGEVLSDTVEKVFMDLIRNASATREYIEVANKLMGANRSKTKVTLTECGGMKMLFDAYILQRAIKSAEKEKQKRSRDKKLRKVS